MRKIYLFFILLFGASVLLAEDFDFMLKKRTASIPMYRFKKTFKLGDSTPLELVDKSGKNTLLGYNLREAIYRFTPAERLRSANLTVFDIWGGGTNVRTMPFRAAYIMSVWFSRLYCSGIQSDQK